MPNVTVCPNRYGGKKYLDFKDVLVVYYSRMRAIGPACEKARNSESIIFRGKSKSEFSAYLNSATTP